MTWDDPEQPLLTPLHTKHASFEAYKENLNEDRRQLWPQVCSPVTLGLAM